MTKHDFEHRHERDPLFAAALKICSMVRKLELQRGSGTLRARLAAAVRRMAISIAEANDRPELRTRRFKTALDCSANASAILRVLRVEELVEETAYERALQQLRAVSVKLEAPRSPPSNAKTIDDRLGQDPVLGTAGRERSTRDGEGMPDAAERGDAEDGSPPLDH